MLHDSILLILRTVFPKYKIRVGNLRISIIESMHCVLWELMLNLISGLFFDCYYFLINHLKRINSARGERGFLFSYSYLLYKQTFV